MLLTDLNEVGFFEGTEKLLEIWFGASNSNSKCSLKRDLRCIPRHELDGLLSIVNATIMSCEKNEFIDAYVLSESSMFVSEKRLIVKTCGITKLLDAVQHMIKLAKKYCGFTKVDNFFYSRRVYLRPEEQQGPHKSFDEEVAFLNTILSGGSSYILGQNKGEEWYLYTMDNNADHVVEADVTLEVLMSELDCEMMKNFTSEKFNSPQDLADSTGIATIIPGSIHDAHVFEPVGYSMNGLFEDSYHTIHVTPQPMCSYVSFETNLRLADYSSLIDRVVKVFRPAKFIVTLFANNGCSSGTAQAVADRLYLDGYRCDDTQFTALKNYSLVYMHYVLC